MNTENKEKDGDGSESRQGNDTHSLKFSITQSMNIKCRMSKATCHTEHIQWGHVVKPWEREEATKIICPV